MIKFVKAAFVVKTHGYKGDIVIKKETNISNSLFEECLEEGNAIFVEKDGIPVPFFISADSLYFFNDNTARLHFDSINSVEKANKFVGEKIYFTQDCISDKKIEDLNPFLWKNFNVIDKKLGFIGKLVDYNEEIAQNPLIIIQKEDKELLIPYQEAFIIKVSIKNKEIITLLPDGFIDLYHK